MPHLAEAFFPMWSHTSPGFLHVLPLPPLHVTTSKVMVIVWRLRGNIIWTVLRIANVLPLQWAQLTKTVHTARLGLEFVFVFLGCMIYFMFMYVLFYLGQLSHLPSCFGAGITNLNEPPSSFLLPPLLRVRSWLHTFKGHCEQQAMRDEGVVYVAGHPWLNGRCTRLPGCIRLRNDLYCVGSVSYTHLTLPTIYSV